MEIIVHHSRSCRADAYGVAACFGRIRDLGVAKYVRFGNKKNKGVNFENYFKKVKKNHDIQVLTTMRKCNGFWPVQTFLFLVVEL